LGQGFTSADALEQVDIGTSSFISPCDVCFCAPVALIFKMSPLGAFILHLGLLIRVVVLQHTCKSRVKESLTTKRHGVVLLAPTNVSSLWCGRKNFSILWFRLRTVPSVEAWSSRDDAYGLLVMNHLLR
jgi:hypothetical protein